MSAYFEQGFSVREPMWHRLGIVLDDYPGRDEAMRLAGHDFDVVEAPVWFERPVELPASTPPGLVASAVEYEKIGGWKSLRRSNHDGAHEDSVPDDGKILNVVRESYGVVQNSTLWDIVDAIVSEPNVRYETAGVLKGGAVLWVLAWLDEPTTIKGDDSPTYPYVMASTTHDGSGACQARATSVRVVCWNTFSAAETEAKASGFSYTFRHSRRVLDRIEDAKLVLGGVRRDHAEFIELANELAGIPVSVGQRELFVAQFIPMPPETLISDTVVKNVETARSAVRSIIGGKTVPDAHRETGYGLLLAATEYLDHVRGARSSATYLGRSLLRNEPAKTKIATLVREVANV